MNDYTTLIKKHNYYDDVSRYSESSGKSSNELDSISDISFSDHELQLKEVLISSEFNQDFISNFDGDSNYNDYNLAENYDGQSSFNQEPNKSSFKAHTFVCTVKGCSKKYTIKDNLKRHIQLHHKNPFVCFEPQCHNMNFSTCDLLERHRQKVHGNQIFYVCKEKGCDKRYDNVNNLETHQRIKGHEGVIQLKKRFTKENRIQKQHISINRVRRQIYKCSKPGCNGSFDELLGYVNHLQVHPDGETQKIHRCDNPDCNRFFTNLYDLWNHTRFEHSKESIERIHSCEESGCDRSFDTLYGLWVHKRSHIRENPELQETLEDNEIKIYERKYPCKVPGCDRIFDSKSAVASHKRIHRTEKDGLVNHVIKKSFVPEYDKKSSSSFGIWDNDRYNRKVYDELEFSQPFHHKQSRTNDKLGQNEVNCDVQGCDFKTKRFEALKQHLHDDHNMKNYYICDKEGCSFCCTNYSNFHKHQQIHIDIAMVRAKEKLFKCEKPGCDKAFERLCHLRYHQNKRNHQTSTSNQQNQNRSVVDHVESKDYVCDEPGCVKVFKRLCHFRYHQNRHHQRSTKLTIPIQQQNHSVVDHVETKDYVCDEPGCVKVFKRLCHFRYHQNRHHKKISTKLTITIQQQIRSEIDEGKKNHTRDEPEYDNVHNHTKETLLLPYVYIENVNLDIRNTYFCDHPGCIYATRQAWNLARHKMIHTGEKRFSCDIEGCNYKCIQKIQLVKHQLTCLKGKRIYFCDQEECDKRFYMLVTLNKHKRDAHGDKSNNIYANDNSITKGAYNLRRHDQINYNEDQTSEDQIDEDQTSEDQIDENQVSEDQIKNDEGQASEDQVSEDRINYNENKALDQINYNEDRALGQIKYNENQAPGDQIKYNENQVSEDQVSEDRINYNENKTLDQINYNEDQALGQIKHNEDQAKDRINYNGDQTSEGQIKNNENQAPGDQIKYNENQASEDQVSEDRINYNEDRALGQIKYNENQAPGDQIKYNENQASEDHEDRINYNENKTLDQINYNEDQALGQIKYNEDQAFEGQVFVEEKMNYPLIKTNQRLNTLNNFEIHPKLIQHACNHQGCNKSFITLTGLKEHNAKDHPKNTSKEFTLKTQSENHNHYEHDVKNVQILNTETNNRKRSSVSNDKSEPNICSYGLRKRPRTNTLNDDDDDCLCKFTGCRKIFDSIHSLKLHQRKFHMITKTYSCNNTGCNFRTKFFEKLEKHHVDKHGIIM